MRTTPGDALLTRESFEQHHLGLQVHVVVDGEEAMRFLRRTGDCAGAQRPTLGLLDLNLLRRRGLEVLADLKADRDLRIIPVVVFTSPAGAPLCGTQRRPVDHYGWIWQASLLIRGL